jgi:hypothetical protein
MLLKSQPFRFMKEEIKKIFQTDKELKKLFFC